MTLVSNKPLYKETSPVNSVTCATEGRGKSTVRRKRELQFYAPLGF